jgi:glycosyltransferase involved in cell wall biosynthesis
VSKDPKVISIVVRVHNDANHVAEFLRTIDAYFAERFANYEYVVVDDQSLDRTPDVVAGVATDLHGTLTLLRLSTRHGRELAMLAGLERAMGDFLFELPDVQMDYPVEVLGRMYDTALSGYDIVGATPKRLPAWARLFYWWANRLSAYDPPLSYEHIRVASRRAVDALSQLREHVRFRQVLYRYTGYRQTQLTYDATRRPQLRSRDTFEFGMNVMLSFTDLGVRTAHFLWVFFFVGALGGIVWTIVRSALSDSLPPWWLDIGILLALAFGGVFLLLGFILEYLARILAEVRSRPLYTLDKAQALVVTPTESARAAIDVPPEDRASEPVVEPLMVAQQRNAIRDRQMAEGEEPHTSNASD